MIQEGVLKRMPDGTFRPEYFIKDHLGSVRVCYTDNPATPTPDVLQVNNYYPFGMSMNSSEGENAYKYNGKELYEDQGMGAVYGARFYDAELGRWHVVDPMAEKYYGWSPYNYVADNPLRFVDPDGRTLDWFENEKTGEIMNVKGESEVPESEKGNGWVNIGEDDMFGNKNIPDGAVGTKTALSAEESIGFMSENGYSLETKEAKVKEVIDKQYHPEGDGPIILDIPIDSEVNPITVTYIPMSYEEVGHDDSDKTTKTTINRKTMTVRETSYFKRTYQYGSSTEKNSKDAQDFGKKVTPWQSVGEKFRKLLKKL